MNKVLKIIAFTLIVGVIAAPVFGGLSLRITTTLFGYEKAPYEHQLNFLFQNEALKTLKVKSCYKSRENGSLYFLSIDSLPNVSVIESRNFSTISLNDVEVKPVKEIKVTQAKTYITFLQDSFPIIEQELNPRKSTNLKIWVEDPFCPVIMNQKNNSYLIKGTFQVVSFRNTQNCSIVSYPKRRNNELLIIKAKGRLYFITNTTVKSLEKIINHSLL